MAETILFKDTPIDPVSLNGVNHADINLTGKLYVEMQFKPLTNSGYLLFYRLDETPEALGTTLGAFKPQGVLETGTADSFWIDPALDETPTMHVLLTDSTGTAVNGGAADWVFLAAYRVNTD